MKHEPIEARMHRHHLSLKAMAQAEREGRDFIPAEFMRRLRLASATGKRIPEMTPHLRLVVDNTKADTPGQRAKGDPWMNELVAKILGMREASRRGEPN